MRCLSRVLPAAVFIPLLLACVRSLSAGENSLPFIKPAEVPYEAPADFRKQIEDITSRKFSFSEKQDLFIGWRGRLQAMEFLRSFSWFPVWYGSSDKFRKYVERNIRPRKISRTESRESKTYDAEIYISPRPFENIGAVTVRAGEPDCPVYFNGVYIGRTPIEKYPLPPDVYDVEILALEKRTGFRVSVPSSREVIIEPPLFELAPCQAGDRDQEITAGLRWSLDLEGTDPKAVFDTPGGPVLFLKGKAAFRGCDAATGLTLWETPLPVSPEVAPVSCGDRIIWPGIDRLLHALDPGTGEVADLLHLGGDTDVPLAVTPSAVITSAWMDGEGATVKCLDPASLEERWSQSLSGKVIRLAVSDKMVLAVTRDADISIGMLIAMDIEDGDVLWKEALYELDRSIVVGKGETAFWWDGNEKAPGHFINNILDPEGAPVTVETGEGLGDAVMAGDALFFLTSDSRLYSVEADSGSPRWARILPSVMGKGDLFHLGKDYVAVTTEPEGPGRESVLMVLSIQSGLTIYLDRGVVAGSVTAMPGKRVLFIKASGMAALVDLENGYTAWEHKLIDLDPDKKGIIVSPERVARMAGEVKAASSGERDVFLIASGPARLESFHLELRPPNNMPVPFYIQNKMEKVQEKTAAEAVKKRSFPGNLKEALLQIDKDYRSFYKDRLFHETYIAGEEYRSGNPPPGLGEQLFTLCGRVNKELPLFIEALADADPLVLAPAARVLGSCKEILAVDDLVKAAGRASNLVAGVDRWTGEMALHMTLQALADIADPDTVGPLSKIFLSTKDEIAASILARYMVRISEYRAAPILAEQLEGNNKARFWAAVEGLGEAHFSHTRDIIMKTLMADRPYMKMAGLDIMSRQLSGGREVKPAPDPDLLKLLVTFISAGDVPVALEASEVLVSAGWTGPLDEAVKSGKLSDVAGLYPALIMSGREDALDLLVKAMTEHGDLRMYKLYRGSQRTRLVEAATLWGKNNGNPTEDEGSLPCCLRWNTAEVHWNRGSLRTVYRFGKEPLIFQHRGQFHF